MAVTVSDIAAKARRLHREQKLTLIVIDYIQLVQGRSTTSGASSRWPTSAARSKLLAKDLDLPVLALSQLNRGPENRPDKRPSSPTCASRARSSRTPTRCMFIYRDDVYDEESPDAGKAELIIAKQRNGPTGTVKLHFARSSGASTTCRTAATRRRPRPASTPARATPGTAAGGGGDVEPPF